MYTHKDREREKESCGLCHRGEVEDGSAMKEEMWFVLGGGTYACIYVDIDIDI